MKRSLFHANCYNVDMPSVTAAPIIYQDRWLVVLEKPSGLLTEPGRGPDKQDCLVRRVQTELPTARVVHRLDRDTSGVLLMALDAETHRKLSALFAERRVDKAYVADVVGAPATDEGLIDAAIAKNWQRPPRYLVDACHGRPATTAWRVLSRNSQTTRIQLLPITGRSHQLRVHMEHVGHPILGDPLYGTVESSTAADRLRLHAVELSLTHPTTAKLMIWRSECPF